jgi:hypothetical protein
VQQSAPAHAASAAPATGDAQALRQLREQLCPLLESGDIAAQTWLQQHQDLLMQALSADAAQRLQRLVSDFDFDAANTYLAQLAAAPAGTTPSNETQA